jgi:hypothetical protein
MNSNQKNLSVWTVIIPLLVGVFSGIGTTTYVYFAFYSPQLAKYQGQLDIMNKTLSIQNESLSLQNEQIGIMNASLVKRVQLEMKVVPDSSWNFSLSSNGSMKLTNTTLSIPRYEPTVFHIYVSNVGNAIAHLLYWTKTIFAPPYTWVDNGLPIKNIQNIVLAPYDLYNMTYTFDPSTISTNINELNFTFVVMSTESIIYETFNATLG